MSDLKSCPFCGGNDLDERISELPMNYIHCKSCGAEGPMTSDSFGSKEEAWNARADDWMPIETAPKDKFVLVYFESGQMCAAINTICTSKYGVDYDIRIWAKRKKAFVLDELRGLTHWMHLPQPPNEKE